MSKINPYKVLQLNQDFTLDELKKQYKNLAFANHPDKGGSEELFNIITKSYKKLIKVYKAKEEGKRNYMDLKSEFNAHINQETVMAHNELSGPYNPFQNNSLFQNNIDLNSNKMNNLANSILQPPQSSSSYSVLYQDNNKSQFKGMTQDQFNGLYEKTRLEHSYDRGYGNLMMASSKVREDIDIKKKKEYGNSKSFKKQNFNDDFDNQKITKINKQLVVYKEPQTILNLSTLGCNEIANTNIEDFSGQNNSLKTLNYTDYLIAHSTTKLIDKKLMKQRPEFANIDELEKERANISYDLSEEDKKKIAKQQKKEEKDELERLKMIKKRDKLEKQQYKFINNAIGYYN